MPSDGAGSWARRLAALKATPQQGARGRRPSGKAKAQSVRKAMPAAEAVSRPLCSVSAVNRA